MLGSFLNSIFTCGGVFMSAGGLARGLLSLQCESCQSHRQGIPEPSCHPKPQAVQPCPELCQPHSLLPFPLSTLTPLSLAGKCLFSSWVGVEPGQSWELLAVGTWSRRTQPLLSAALPADVTSWE